MSDINVNEENLERILGDKVQLPTELDRITARVLTDSDYAKTAGHKMNNARYWVTYAYKMGKEAGEREANDHWKSKLRAMFGV